MEWYIMLDMERRMGFSRVHELIGSFRQALRVKVHKQQVETAERMRLQAVHYWELLHGNVLTPEWIEWGRRHADLLTRTQSLVLKTDSVENGPEATLGQDPDLVATSFTPPDSPLSAPIQGHNLIRLFQVVGGGFDTVVGNDIGVKYPLLDSAKIIFSVVPTSPK